MMSFFRQSFRRLLFCRQYCQCSGKERDEIRTRYAPSPTGQLHLGGLRTALYNYCHAKKTKGSFILRIEDTDQKRLVPNAKENLLKMLQWAGVHPDEGPEEIGGKFGPYIQSERTEIYQHHISLLLQSGHAYRCFCTEERLKELRSESREDSSHGHSYYDRKCSYLTASQIEENLKKEKPFTVRLRVEREGSTSWDDVSRGQISIMNIQIDDQILMKSDGTPTYHFACVVDDHLMNVSHVVRGEEWISSTPKHIMLFRHFGWNEPKFCHLPLLLNNDRSKLSKRQSGTSVEYYKEKGYLQEAIINFIALLGWNPRRKNEVMTLKEIVSLFDLNLVNKAGAVVDEDKLKWLNTQHIQLLVNKAQIDIHSLQDNKKKQIIRGKHGRILKERRRGEERGEGGEERGEEGEEREEREGEEREGEERGEESGEEREKREGREKLIEYFRNGDQKRVSAYYSDSYLLKTIAISSERVVMPNDLFQQFPFLFQKPNYESEEAINYFGEIVFDNMLEVISKVFDQILEEATNKEGGNMMIDEYLNFLSKTPLSPSVVTSVVKKNSKEYLVHPKQIYNAIRFVLTSSKIGPPIVDVMVVIGLDEIVQRLDQFVDEFAFVSKVFED